MCMRFRGFHSIMETCICAIDQGTQSTRVLLFDKEKALVAKHQEVFTQHTPRSGWVEHDPLEILQTVSICIDGALAAAKSQGKRAKIAAVGITNQRETTVAWDRRTGKPLHNAIVWFDNRTSAICRDFKKKFGSADYFRAQTGLPISTYFSAYKFWWLHENVPDVKQAVAQGNCMLGTIDTWLIWNLTGGTNGGVFVTDVTNASRTNLMDLKLRQWQEELLTVFGVRLEMLAEIRSNAEVYGKILEGPLAGVPISGSIGDQQSAMLGHLCKKGEAKNTFGTGCFVLLHTGSNRVDSSHGLISTVAHQLGSEADVQFALEGSIAVAGLGIRWLQENLGVIESPGDSERLASSVADTSGVYFVPAFNGLLAPHWRDDARGAILGITSYTKAAHIVRAMLEAIAWQTKEVLDAMRDDAELGSPIELIKVDGGASANNLLMQLQADILQLPVHRPEMQETSALGAAIAAGIGIGFWREDEVFERIGTCRKTFEPGADASDIEQKYNRWQKAVQRSYDLADFAD